MSKFEKKVFNFFSLRPKFVVTKNLYSTFGKVEPKIDKGLCEVKG